MRNCRICGEPIPQRRLEALPGVRTCIKCSDEEPLKGVMTWEHKTAPVINIVTKEQHTRAKSHDRRSFNAHLGVNSYNNQRMINSVNAARDHSAAADIVRHPDNPGPTFVVVETGITHPPSRCHPEKPKVNALGHCMDCALEWYRKHL